MTTSDPSMLVTEESTIMRTFATHTSHLRGHRPRAVVLAVSDASGVDDAVDLLTNLPVLTCPVVVSATPTTLDALRDRIGAMPGPFCEAGRWLSDAAVWVVPEGGLVTVHQDRWVLTPHADADHDAQVGRLCSSLKASFRSRVFIISTAGPLDDNPFVRLLVQRGAPLVETQDRPERALADHASVAELVAHLAVSVGTTRKAIA
ncbi:MAG: hypothetical protein AAGA90_16465 [Actinomycetota bacterium]